MLFDLSFPLAANPETRAVDRQVQWFGLAANRDVDGQGGLPQGNWNNTFSVSTV
nr:hypothetical protein [Laribacter hongkongensis]